MLRLNANNIVFVVIAYFSSLSHRYRLCFFTTGPAPGGRCMAVSKNSSWRSVAVKKSESDFEVFDNGEACESYPRKWGVLMYEDYQRFSLKRWKLLFLIERVRFLSTNERRQNEKLSFDSVIVEEFFGREARL